MFVLRFFLDSVSSAAKSVFCRPARSQGDREMEQEREAVPIMVSNDPIRYASLQQPADELSPADHQQQQQQQLGLTAEYEPWIGSKEATRYAMLHLAVYFLLAVIGFSFVFEDWPIIDSIYFAVVVFTTVGYGDLDPSNDLSRSFVIFFAIYGIVILGILLGLVGEFILEKNDTNLKMRMANARIKIMEQFVEDDTALPREKRSVWFEVRSIILAEAPIVVILLVLGAPIVYLEGWDLLPGVYWMVVTGTTIGFGDLGPTQMATRCICIVWIPLAVAVLGECMGRIAGAYIERRNDDKEDEFLQRGMTLADLRRMDTDNDDKVSPTEFLQYMLVALQKVEKEEIVEILDLFKKLDKSNNGFIEKEDLMSNYNLCLRPRVAVTACNPSLTLDY